MTIYDLVTSAEIVAYWELKNQDKAPYMFEELFPSEQKLGLMIEWLKGAKGVPIVLKPSAFDVASIPRPRIGFEKLSAQMPFFKESKYVDEELRQKLNMVLESGNQAYIDSIVKNIFDDEIELLEGAAAQRERMRAMLITSGVVMMEGNGQVYEYDYHMPESHKKTVTKSWSDPTADIIGDIRSAIDTIVEDTGVIPERAVCSSKVFGYFRNNKAIKDTILVLSNGSGYVSDNRIVSYLSDELGIEVVTNDKKYADEKGTIQRYVPDDVFSMFPSGQLGTTWFGTTPEQSDLLSSNVANVEVTDVGVAVTTIDIPDPVTVNTKVTQICLPDFPTADQVFIYDVIKEES